MVVDAGARDALSDPRWAALPRARIYGFDPDPAEVARLNQAAQAAGMDARYFPTALWSSPGRFPFHENNAPGGGSFYPQNRALTDRWKFECIDGQKTPARDLFFPTAIADIECDSLDAWGLREHVTTIDFLKMNIQGAEMEVLCGATGQLGGVLGILAEVSFVESYLHRPMFSEIDEVLRRQGFEFFSLLNRHEVGRLASPFTVLHAPSYRGSGGQLIEAHALYLRDPIRDACDAGTGHIKLAMLAEAFEQPEYAFEIVASLIPHDERVAPIFDAAAAQYQTEYGVRVAA